jgi:hypothetical protein
VRICAGPQSLSPNALSSIFENSSRLYTLKLQVDRKFMTSKTLKALLSALRNAKVLHNLHLHRLYDAFFPKKLREIVVSGRAISLPFLEEIPYTCWPSNGFLNLDAPNVLLGDPEAWSVGSETPVSRRGFEHLALTLPSTEHLTVAWARDKADFDGQFDFLDPDPDLDIKAGEFSNLKSLRIFDDTEMYWEYRPGLFRSFVTRCQGFTHLDVKIRDTFESMPNKLPTLPNIISLTCRAGPEDVWLHSDEEEAFFQVTVWVNLFKAMKELREFKVVVLADGHEYGLDFFIPFSCLDDHGEDPICPSITHFELGWTASAPASPTVDTVIPFHAPHLSASQSRTVPLAPSEGLPVLLPDRQSFDPAPPQSGAHSQLLCHERSHYEHL